MTRNAERFQRLYNEARIAGLKAVEAAQVVPMVVQERDNPLDDASRVNRQWFVADGVCGFAWVTVRPANCAFAKWLNSNNLARRDTYEGGMKIWISEFNQSMQRKEAYALAFADVLRNEGIKAYAGSRMD